VARSTAPILAAGGITVANRVVFHQQPVDWRVVTATGLTAAMLALVETASPELALGLAWVALATILLTRVDPNVPSPTESLLEWWEK
jgi:hypothetical protein